MNFTHSFSDFTVDSWAELDVPKIIKWKSLVSEKTGIPIKQHAYVEKISEGGNIRNISLCGGSFLIGEDGKPELFENIKGESMYPDRCKTCKRLDKA